MEELVEEIEKEELIELVRKSKNGDKEAFAELISRMEGQLYRIAKIRMKQDDDIYDAIQETILEAYRYIKKLKNNQYFKTWIIRILINKCNYIYKKSSKKREISYEEIPTISQNDDVEAILNFEFMCKNLKYQERIIIILYYMERYSDREISEILKMNENTVKTKRTRAKNKIKKFLEGDK